VIRRQDEHRPQSSGAYAGVVRRAMLICNSGQIRERHVHRATPVTLLVSMLKGSRPQ